MMRPRSFSPSKLPRPPPPPPLPHSKRKRTQKRILVMNGGSEKSNSYLESPLIIQQAQANDDAENSVQLCEVHKVQGISSSTFQPPLQDHTEVSVESRYNTDAEIRNTTSISRSCEPFSSSFSGDVTDSESSVSPSWRQRLRLFHIFQRRYRSGEQSAFRIRSNDNNDGSNPKFTNVVHNNGIQLLNPASPIQNKSFRPKKIASTVSSCFGDDHSSVQDFDESEWTPPDSSFGAAIPIAGWIPKSIRRMIEWTLIAAVFGFIVLFVVQTSVRADARYKNHKSNNNNPTISDDSSSWNYLADDQYVMDFDNATSSNNTLDDDFAR